MQKCIQSNNEVKTEKPVLTHREKVHEIVSLKGGSNHCKIAINAKKKPGTGNF